MLAKIASLVLEDGTTFKGRLFGSVSSVSGEVGKLSEIKANVTLLEMCVSLSPVFCRCSLSSTSPVFRPESVANKCVTDDQEVKRV